MPYNPIFDLTNQFIKDSFMNIVQKGPTSNFYNGLGYEIDLSLSSFYFQQNAPTGPVSNGSIWYHSETGALYFYVTDEDASQWVSPAWPINPVSSSTKDILFVSFDSGSSDIPVGKKDFRIAPYNCRIEDWYLIAGQKGSIEIDIRSSNFDNYPETNSIINSSKPILSSQIKNKDSNLSLWSNLSEGDVIEFCVDSNVNIKSISAFIKISKI
jgi:hypothetical protein